MPLDLLELMLQMTYGCWELNLGSAITVLLTTEPPSFQPLNFSVVVNVCKTVIKMGHMGHMFLASRKFWV